MTNAGNGITMRFTLPDNATGGGVAGSLAVMVNGTNVHTVNLSSYWAWTYFVSSHPRNTPGVRPRMRFDEIRFSLPVALQTGDVLRIQKVISDSFEYGIDYVEVEAIPAPLLAPAGYISVTAHGANGGDSVSDLPAFSNAWTAARNAGTGLYIPPGFYVLPGKWNLGDSTGLNIQGAGIWYTELHFPTVAVGAGGIRAGDSTERLAMSHFYMSTALNARHLSGSGIVDYKAFDGTYGSNSVIHNTWVTHFENGAWIGDYVSPIKTTTHFTFMSNRVRNTYADGINLTQGTRLSTIRHNDFRDSGDDAVAVWAASTAGAPSTFSNVIHNNTIEFTYRAGGVGLFGGYGYQVFRNIIKDGIDNSGIRLTEDFPGYLFQQNASIRIYENTIIGRGTSLDLWNLPRGAIEISGAGVRHVYFEDNEIYQSQRHAIQLRGGFHLYFTNTIVSATGLDSFNDPRGAAIRQYDLATTATFSRLIMTDIELDPPVRKETDAAQLAISTEFPFTDVSSMTVPEGGLRNFSVKLTFVPSGVVTVTIARISGDTDLTVQSGAALLFNSANWNAYQAVTIAAAEDVDTLESSAVFEVKAVRYGTTSVTALEVENDRNHPPVAYDDETETDEDTPVVIYPLANDTDEDAHTLSIISATAGQHGSVNITNTFIVYFPAPGFNGDDAIQYTISDGNGGRDTGTVQITVREVIAVNPYRLSIAFRGYDRGEILSNFVSKVLLHPAIPGFSYNQFASPSGQDLRFEDDEGHLLYHEIEQWNPVGTSTVWVQIPRLHTGTVMHASWGSSDNRDAPPYTTNGAVWSQGFEAVYHLGETNGTRRDSSTRRRDGLPFGNPTHAAGMAGRSTSFDGNGSYIEMPSTFARFNGFVDLTVEFWFKADEVAPSANWQFSPVMFQGNGESAWMITFGDGFAGNTLGNRVDQGGWTTTVHVANVQTGRWYHLTSRYTPTGTGNWQLFLDGSNVAKGTRTGLIGFLTEKNAIGGNTVGIDRWFDGAIDEVRISSAPRSTNWIHASWMNLARHTNMLQYGSVTGPPPPELTVLIDFGNELSYRGARVVNPDPSGFYWNSVHDGIVHAALVDHTNRPTSLALAFDQSTGTDSFNGPGGDIDAAALGKLGGSTNAVNDYYTTSRFQIRNLELDMTYKLTFFGSHKYSTDDTTVYMLHGDNQYGVPLRTASLNIQTPGSPALHNRSSTAQMDGVMPAANGTLFISFAGSGGNLGYLNAMQIEGTRTGSTYAAWAANFGLSGARDADDDQDGVDNFSEYLFGGHPADANQRGFRTDAFVSTGGGPEYFHFIHPRRTDNPRLRYFLESTTNLLGGPWTENTGMIVQTTGMLSPHFQSVTNRLPAGQPSMHIRLGILERP